MPHRTNRLLQALSPELHQAILSLGRTVELPAGTVLYSPGEAPAHVYFLLSGLVSVAVSVADGGCAEVGMAGTEGLIGSSWLLGPQRPVARWFVQLSGTSLRLPIADARRLFAENSEFRARVLEYMQAELLFTSQLAACNKLHQAAERTARWLLTAADMSASETMPLTQEGLSQMLGTRRTTIALVAGDMQRKGVLRYRRGLVKIANRESLAASACDCYGVTKRLMDGLYT